jgi:hypothetical protein
MDVLAEVLKKIRDHEKSILDEHEIKHGPTIGKMYEGLTNKILGRSSLDKYNLKVVSGFMRSGKDMSGQIDCMVVFGEGENIPNTDDFIYPINQVIAVIEVKKKLHSTDFVEAYHHLNETLHLSIKDYARQQEEKTLNFSTEHAAKEYARLFKVRAPRYSEARKLPPHKYIIYHTLVRESLTPVRIAIGYNGFKSEQGLRNSINILYKNKAQVKGYGIINMPNLIISDGYSLVKTNGMPYKGFWHEKKGWGWLASSSSNPILLILEILYYRIEMVMNVEVDRGLDLHDQVLYSLLTAKPVQTQQGFVWTYQMGTAQPPKNVPRDVEWRPLEISGNQKNLLDLLCKNPSLDANGAALKKFIQEQGIKDINDLIGPLVEEDLLLSGGNVLSINPQSIKIVKFNEKWYCGDNAGGRLDKWLAQTSGLKEK